MQSRQTATGFMCGWWQRTGNGNLRFVADFLHVKGDGGVVNGRVAGSRPVLQIEDEIAVGVGEGPASGTWTVWPSIWSVMILL
jgi:hypothetical protein